MPSIVFGYIPASGAVTIISGNPYSGYVEPIGGIQLYASPLNSGLVYVAFSGGGPPAAGNFMTTNSGGMPLSGGGLLDGMPIAPGGGYFIPKIAITNRATTSGQFNLFGTCDAACSGQARLYWEAF